MADAAPLPPQIDGEHNRRYPLFIERIILLLVLMGVGGARSICWL